MVNIRDKCGCGIPDLSQIPKGTTINIEQPTPGEIVLKFILCIVTFVIVTFICKWIGIPVLYSAIIGAVLALCCGGCLSFIIQKLESLIKLH